MEGFRYFIYKKFCEVMVQYPKNRQPKEDLRCYGIRDKIFGKNVDGSFNMVNNDPRSTNRALDGMNIEPYKRTNESKKQKIRTLQKLLYGISLLPPYLLFRNSYDKKSTLKDENDNMLEEKISEAEFELHNRVWSEVILNKLH